MPPSAIASSVRARHLLLAAAQQELEHRRRRELRRAAPAAPLAGRSPSRRFACACVEQRLVERLGRRLQPRARRGCARRASPPTRSTSSRWPSHASATASSTCLNAGSPCRGSGGKYVPPKNGSPAGRQEDGHRPAALAGQRDDRVHVDRVEVGPLLAVDLDADEVLVHHARGQRVLERLALHHVAPVAGRVADREQDRLVLVARARERLVAPRVPVDRVGGVLEQVRRGLLREAVHASSVGV